MTHFPWALWQLFFSPVVIKFRKLDGRPQPVGHQTKFRLGSNALQEPALDAPTPRRKGNSVPGGSGLRAQGGGCGCGTGLSHNETITSNRHACERGRSRTKAAFSQAPQTSILLPQSWGAAIDFHHCPVHTAAQTVTKYVRTVRTPIPSRHERWCVVTWKTGRGKSLEMLLI